VVAQGVGVYWADGSGTTGYTNASGTSCSTPLVAGAAALILSAHPQLTNMQIRDALMKTAVQRKDTTPETAVYPNNYYGRGFVDAYAAAVSLGPVNTVPAGTVPQVYALLQNYPNPFNNRTTLIFYSPTENVVDITVFNLLGQQVKTLFHGLAQPGSKTVYWDGTNEQGRAIPTGVYFARLKTPFMVLSEKMLYLK
jgi:subtilisin family serine protease